MPDIGPTGFTFNQFLLNDEEPLLFHTGHRSMFPSISEAIERVTPVDSLHWIAFGHVESDECGAMNEFLAASPMAKVAHGALGCLVSIDEMANHPPRGLANGEVIDLGTMRVRHIDTPMFHMGGTPESCSKRRRAPCCVGTSSPTSARGLRSPPETSSVRPWRRKQCFEVRR